MSRAVFFDRDGVLNVPIMRNETAASPRTFGEFEFVEDAHSAVEQLRDHGFKIVVVTNQPDVGRGLMDQHELDKMTDELFRRLHVDAVEVCGHSGHENCRCRKPKPGMILDAAHRLDIDPRKSWTVGDRWVDLVAGLAAQTQVILIDRPYSFETTSSGSPEPSLQTTTRARTLTDAVEHILQSPVS
jgi:D-glycero-D-manno-heptose 1,7-bisphosphate phosphatase